MSREARRLAVLSDSAACRRFRPHKAHPAGPTGSQGSGGPTLNAPLTGSSSNSGTGE
ncbi:hypothetical protein [Burkholderia sp. Ax-1724]|uniref:hypothetical protein n=1 Tax=Burkholderia sp. Ax-1724 TaxID=2608336 RepID=UPI00141E2370|nr:hypothetical protein [Burkholderia sp. Ax-1724]